MRCHPCVHLPPARTKAIASKFSLFSIDFFSSLRSTTSHSHSTSYLTPSTAPCNSRSIPSNSNSFIQGKSMLFLCIAVTLWSLWFHSVSRRDLSSLLGASTRAKRFPSKVDWSYHSINLYLHPLLLFTFPPPAWGIKNYQSWCFPVWDSLTRLLVLCWFLTAIRLFSCRMFCFS